MASVPSDVSLWTHRRIAYEFEDGYKYKSEVRKAMDKWQDAAGVSFQPRVSEANYVVVRTPPDGTASNSPIGMRGGEQDVFINAGFKALHELGHTLGLIHEQSRGDRDTFVEIEWANIVNGNDNGNFAEYAGSNNLTSYDLSSVMHYPAPATGWQGNPPNQEVWTMRWKADRNKYLGAGHYQGWSDLSDPDKQGLRTVYDAVPVPMGRETDHGSWKFAYAAAFAYTVKGRTFLYAQNSVERNWFIKEVLPDGTLGDETANGTWKFFYASQFAYTVAGRVFFYGQNMNERNWFVQELLADGKMGNETANGTWKFAYAAAFPFSMGGKTFFYAQNMNERNYFIQELLADGKMGNETANGTWKFAYRVQVPFAVGDRQFFYGQNLTDKNWFIQEITKDGKLGPETAHGTWNNAYATQFTYVIDGNAYLYGQNHDTRYWFIQRLTSDGKMGEEIQSGTWTYAYYTQIALPRTPGGQYFFGQNLKEKNWFVQQLLNV